MARYRPRAVAVLAAGAAIALTLAACGSDDSSSTSATSTSSSASTSASTGAGAATVDLSDNAALGTEVLVDSDGRTLYLFEKDDEADESYCSGACAEAWPPLTSTGKASAGDGLDAGQLTTFEREDGDTQVAYAGHPLYLYAGDAAPGMRTATPSINSAPSGTRWTRTAAPSRTIRSRRPPRTTARPRRTRAAGTATSQSGRCKLPSQRRQAPRLARSAAALWRR